MELLFELRILSPLGPTTSKLQVEIEGNTAWCSDFDEKDRDLEFQSHEELIAKVADEYEECFRILSDSIIEIDADPEIAELVQDYLWEYHHEEEGTELEERENWRRNQLEVIHLYEHLETEPESEENQL